MPLALKTKLFLAFPAPLAQLNKLEPEVVEKY
uniref:Uncharacterized protein n=1 Tax=Moniliophthora roreri TaxID=221103 RepID=A0A0W0FAV2_MONRR